MALGCVLYIQPFHDTSSRNMAEKVACGEYYFLSPWWDDISESAKDLVSSLLISDPVKRFTIKEVQAHRWMSFDQQMSSAAVVRDESIELRGNRCVGKTLRGHGCKLKISKKDLDTFWAMNASLSHLIQLRYCKRQHRKLDNEDARKRDSLKLILDCLQQRMISKTDHPDNLRSECLIQPKMEQDHSFCKSHSLVEHRKASSNKAETQVAPLLRPKIESKLT